jgi:3-phosphoshikimate 1-carboxyvinyltransferase
MEATFSAPKGLGGAFEPPPDKSISHRALMLGALSSGECRIHKPLETGDCVSTRSCLEILGCSFERMQDGLVVRGIGLRGFREPGRPLDAENSGTSARLLSGLLAGLPLFAVLTGDSSLLGRPMARVVEPLRRMGARIEGREGGRFAPLCFLPGSGGLAPLDWELAVSSAQVKGSLMLAALRAEGASRLSGRIASRDHTERMLRALGVRIETVDGALRIIPPRALPDFRVEIPGDVSSSAFFLASALICGREIQVRNCGVNPSRCGFLAVMRRMGARVEVGEERTSLGEPIGTIRILPGELRGTSVEAEEVPDLIDEAPLVAVLGLFARGITEVRGVGELRVKESDRLSAIARMAKSLGGEMEIRGDGFRVEGPQKLVSGRVDPEGDHRIAMAAAAAAAGIPGGVRVSGIECTRVSYPDFARDFRVLGGEVA